MGKINQGVFKRLNENESRTEVENLDKTNQCLILLKAISGSTIGSQLDSEQTFWDTEKKVE